MKGDATSGAVAMPRRNDRRFMPRTIPLEEAGVFCGRKSEILKLHDSRIGNPKFRNLKLDSSIFGWVTVQFKVSKFRVSNAGIVQFRDFRFLSRALNSNQEFPRSVPPPASRAARGRVTVLRLLS